VDVPILRATERLGSEEKKNVLTGKPTHSGIALLYGIFLLLKMAEL
jgi:hypothetical protein